MRKKLLAMVITIPLMFSACSSSEERNIGKEEDFNKVLININKSAAEVSKNELNIDEKFKNWIKEDDDYTKVECENLLKYVAKYENGKFKVSEENKYKYDKAITYDEAKEDIDMFFKLFRNCYAGYGYFGGDEVFYKAKEQILQELEGKKEIEAWELYKLITFKLDFLKDYHTNQAGTDRFSKIYFMCNDIEWFKNETGYYKIVENKPCYIKQINKDKHIDKFMKLTINKDGKLVYTIAVNQVADKKQKILGVNVDVEYTSGKNSSSEKITLEPIREICKGSKDISYSVNDDIPITKLGRMYSNSEDDKEIKDFIDTGEKLRKSPVSIIDLRGTGGGYPKIGADWLENYSGQNYRSRSVNLNLNSNLIKHCNENDGIGDGCKSPLFEIKPMHSGEYSRITNENIVFVLVDKLDVSASEIFIEELKEMDNVILVGSNTGGCFITGGEIMYTLKNSKIPQMFGTTLHITPYSDDFEFKGFEPDIIIDTNQALDRVEKLIKYYKLNEKNKN